MTLEQAHLIVTHVELTYLLPARVVVVVDLETYREMPDAELEGVEAHLLTRAEAIARRVAARKVVRS